MVINNWEIFSCLGKFKFQFFYEGKRSLKIDRETTVVK